MPELLEYCIGNVDPSTRSRLRSLDCETRATPCLDRCGSCFDGPVLVCDGTARAADSWDELLGAIEGD